ncbi:unnamed protein product [Arctogadus glacialis]
MKKINKWVYMILTGNLFVGNNYKGRGSGHRGELRIVQRGQANSQWKGRGHVCTDGSPQEESAHERSWEIGMPPESELVATVLVQMKKSQVQGEGIQMSFKTRFI